MSDEEIENVIQLRSVARDNDGRRNLAHRIAPDERAGIPRPITLANPDLPPERWLELFMQEHRITYDYKTNGIRQGREVIEPGVAISMMKLCAYNNGVAHLRSLLKDALLLWKREQSAIAIKQIGERIRFCPSDGDPIGDWVEAATGERSELDIVVMKHFIWQVKRKIFNFPVEWHMMPVLFGKSGGGKSVAVHKLIRPLQDVSMVTDMGVFMDRFGKRQFTRNYVMFFDELEGAGTVDVNRLKQVITSPVMEFRVMHSETVHSAPQSCTFIGCSNYEVRDQIKDPTSARRFWQLNCQDRLDWKALNQIDYEALWRSVDERTECPILLYIDDIRQVQEREIRSRDLIEQFLESCCQPYPYNGESPTTGEIYQRFKEWCGYQNINSFSGTQKFARNLPLKVKSLSWNVESQHSNRGTIWNLTIKT